MYQPKQSAASHGAPAQETVRYQKFLIAMAKARVEPVELAERAELSKNIVYSMRRGFYTKPKYLGLLQVIGRAYGTDFQALLTESLGS